MKGAVLPDLQIRKRRHGEVRKVIPNPTTAKGWSLDGDPGSLPSDCPAEPLRCTPGLSAFSALSRGRVAAPAHPQSLRRRRSARTQHGSVPRPSGVHRGGRLTPVFTPRPHSGCNACAESSSGGRCRVSRKPREGETSSARGAQKSLCLSLLRFFI